MSSSLFFAGSEGHLSREEIVKYRTVYGKEFSSLGFNVLDPTLGKDIDNISSEELNSQDLELVDKSHVVVAYLPRPSDGAFAEIKRANKTNL